MSQLLVGFILIQDQLPKPSLSQSEYFVTLVTEDGQNSDTETALLNYRNGVFRGEIARAHQEEVVVMVYSISE